MSAVQPFLPFPWVLFDLLLALLRSFIIEERFRHYKPSWTGAAAQHSRHDPLCRRSRKLVRNAG
jgi:hypothetical protein